MEFNFRQKKMSKGKQFLQHINSSSSSSKSSKPIVVGGAFSVISPEEKDKQKNVSVMPVRSQTQSQPISKQKKISEEKLRRFVNFHI